MANVVTTGGLPVAAEETFRIAGGLVRGLVAEAIARHEAAQAAELDALKEGFRLHGADWLRQQGEPV